MPSKALADLLRGPTNGRVERVHLAWSRRWNRSILQVILHFNHSADPGNVLSTETSSASIGRIVRVSSEIGFPFPLGSSDRYLHVRAIGGSR